MDPYEEPEYYERVSAPCDLATILHRVDSRTRYHTVAQYLADVMLIAMVREEELNKGGGEGKRGRGVGRERSLHWESIWGGWSKPSLIHQINPPIHLSTLQSTIPTIPGGRGTG